MFAITLPWSSANSRTADFFAAYAKAFHPYLDSQLKALLDQQSANLFPNGDGSQQVLNGGPGSSDFPQILVRNSDGIWAPQGKPAMKITLPANGYILGGAVGGNVLFHLRKPDNLPAGPFHHDAKGVMDLLLKTGFLKRTVGPERILVTSLGAPTGNESWTDRWGRRWQVWTWPVPYANGYVSVFALPIPTGFAMLMRMVPATSQHDTAINMQALTDFVSLSYEGTLAQWKDFLADPELLPDAFKDIHLAFDYGKDFHYDSRRMQFSSTSAIQDIDANSMLQLGFCFFPPNADRKVVWDVCRVGLAADNYSQYMLGVVRHQAPPAGLGDVYASYWKKVVDRRHPYDSTAFSDDGMTKIDTVVPPAKNDAKLSVLYSAYVYQPGTQSQAEIKKKLDVLVKGVTVKEQ